MAEQINKIIEFVSNNKNGLLEVRGPAGSGKTFSLVQTANSLLESRNSAGYIISLTNVAVSELQQRLDSRFESSIMTSHHFAIIWLKRFFLSLTYGTKIEWSEESLWREFKEKHITELIFIETFTENIEKNENNYVVTPDKVLKLFSEALEKSKDFADKVVTEIDYIFIDEYQDTNTEFLNALINALKDRLIIVLFGDPMQKIYMSKLDMEYIQNYVDARIDLVINYRSDSKLIPFFNALRLEPEGLNQQPASSQTSQGKIFLISADRMLDQRDGVQLQKETKINDWHYLTTTHYLRIGLDSEESLYTIDSITQSLNDTFVSKGQKKYTVVGVIDNSESIEELQLFMGIGALLKEKYSYIDIRKINKTFDIDATYPVWPVGMLMRFKENIKQNNFDVIDQLDQYKVEVRNWTKSVLRNHSDTFEAAYHLLAYFQPGEVQTIQGVKGLEFDNVVANLDPGTYKSLGLKNLDLKTKGYTSGNNKAANFMLYVAVTRAKKNVAIFVNKAVTPDLLNEVTNFFSENKIDFETVSLE